MQERVVPKRAFVAAIIPVLAARSLSQDPQRETDLEDPEVRWREWGRLVAV